MLRMSLRILQISFSLVCGQLYIKNQKEKLKFRMLLNPISVTLEFDNILCSILQNALIWDIKTLTEMSNEVTKGMCRYACLWGIFILVSFLAIEIVSSEEFYSN